MNYPKKIREENPGLSNGLSTTAKIPVVIECFLSGILAMIFIICAIFALIISGIFGGINELFSKPKFQLQKREIIMENKHYNDSLPDTYHQFDIDDDIGSEFIPALGWFFLIILGFVVIWLIKISFNLSTMEMIEGVIASCLIALVIYMADTLVNPDYEALRKDNNPVK